MMRSSFSLYKIYEEIGDSKLKHSESIKTDSSIPTNKK